MSRIPVAKANLLFEDSLAAETFRCYRIDGVNSGDTLDLSNAFASVKTAQAFTGASGAGIYSLNAGKFPLFCFDSAAGLRNRTVYLMILGDAA